MSTRAGSRQSCGWSLWGIARSCPTGRFFKACYYEDGSEEAFVRRLWTDLFPGEPLPTRGLAASGVEEEEREQ